MGLGVGLSGLALGWFIAPARLLGPLLAPARNGFAVAGGIDGLVVRPAMAVAAACERLERRLFDTVLAVGRINLSFGHAAHSTDTNRIDTAIFGLARRMILAGTQARRLQSGFIHRELALTVIGIALIVAVLLAASFYFLGDS